MRRLAWLAVPTLLLVACINPFGPGPLPSDRWVPIGALSSYPTEFARMRSCASLWAGKVYNDSLAGDVAQFYMVQRGDVRTNGRRAAAVIGTDSLGTFIAIAENYLRDKDVVDHELIHGLQVKHAELTPGGNWHPSSLFNACGVPIAIGE